MTTASWTLAEVAALSGGRVDGDGGLRVSYDQLSSDTRTLKKDDFFLAFRGESHDGHDYVETAFERGVCGVFVDEPQPVDVPAVIVDDTLRGWQTWSHGHRKMWNGGPVVAVTGSSGKTTTKNALGSLLSGAGHVWSTEGNRNNHFGVPWTLLGLCPDHEFAVVEMGMNHRGEISLLSKLAEPDLALITSVGLAHVGHLGSREEILAAKLEIADGLADGATLVLPHDDWVLERLPEPLRERPRLTFGFSPQADVHPVGAILYHGRGTRFSTPDTGTLELHLLGPGPVLSALAAIACVRALGLDAYELGPRLSGLQPEPLRMEPRKWRGADVILDCYNASPESTELAIRFLREVPHSGRRVLVLGELSELGDLSREVHQGLVNEISDIDEVILVGPEFEEFQNQDLPGVGNLRWSALREAASTWLAETVREGDLVLLKASRRLSLERILESPTPGNPL